MEQNFKKLNNLINGAKNILITSHEDPDGDGWGSILGLSYHLEEIGKPHTCFAVEAPLPQFDFLPGIERINNQVKIEEHDLLILMDVGDVKRSLLRDYYHLKDKFKVINIDHHQTTVHYNNQKLVDINIFNPRISATAEIIYNYLEHIKANIHKNLATCLLTGILTDTHNFSNPATTTSSLAVAKKLIAKGASFREITLATLKTRPLGVLKLWGRALARLARDPKTGVVSTAITQKDIRECGVGEEAVEGIANFLNFVEGARVILVLRELDDGKIKGSYRTTLEGTDVAELANEYGGGGHKKSAGFTVEGKIEQTPSGWVVRRG